jgi:hypothetical protein
MSPTIVLIGLQSVLYPVLVTDAVGPVAGAEEVVSARFGFAHLKASGGTGNRNVRLSDGSQGEDDAALC